MVEKDDLGQVIGIGGAAGFGAGLLGFAVASQLPKLSLPSIQVGGPVGEPLNWASQATSEFVQWGAGAAMNGIQNFNQALIQQAHEFLQTGDLKVLGGVLAGAALLKTIQELRRVRSQSAAVLQPLPVQIPLPPALPPDRGLDDDL